VPDAGIEAAYGAIEVMSHSKSASREQRNALGVNA
jgi:hypothetical protein